MKLYCKEKYYTLYEGTMQEVLSSMPDNSVDAIITDPPYEISFMGKGWDATGVAYTKETWEHCFRVLKPGGYLLSFGATRTFHRIAVAIEDAGFEIRDTIMWLYGSGFPKSMNIGLAIDKKNGVESIDTGISSPNARPNSTKNNTLYESGTVGKDFTIKKATNKWQGWGTCLKPAYEPIIVARKPFNGSLVDNVIEYGVGGINIDECRVETEEQIEVGRNSRNNKSTFQASETNNIEREYQNKGRFPANVILTYDDTDFDEVCGGFPKQDSGSASRYFYCAKASKKDRDEGLDKFESKKRFQQGNYSQSPVCSVCGKTFNGTNDHSLCGEHTMIYKSKEKNMVRKNVHPTVKPVELMQYLVRLVTPKNGVVLDCFMGSGSTGKAVMFENRERNANYHFIGVEMTPEYLPICQSRIDYALNKYEYDLEKEKEEMEEIGQLSLF